MPDASVAVSVKRSEIQKVTDLLTRPYEQTDLRFGVSDYVGMDQQQPNQKLSFEVQAE